MSDSGFAPFCYAPRPHERKHGPGGYPRWEHYREWLRDEFDFVCVYCLRREIWERRRAHWVVEHLIPRAKAPELALEYQNLVYACVSCNSAKSDQTIPDPCRHAYGELVFVTDDGRIHAKKREGKRLIRAAALDAADAVIWRRKQIQVLRVLKRHNAELYRDQFALPENLPDLVRFHPAPPRNSKPTGAANCHYEQRHNKVSGRMSAS